MRKYTRLSESGSVNDGALPEFSPPFATEYELNPTNRWGKVGCVFISSAAPISKCCAPAVPVHDKWAEYILGLASVIA